MSEKSIYNSIPQTISEFCSTDSILKVPSKINRLLLVHLIDRTDPNDGKLLPGRHAGSAGLLVILLSIYSSV